jgi:hypothetical protein
MESKGSLLCSQEPATDHYSELDTSNSHLTILFPLKYIIILSFHLCLGLPSGHFPSGFPTKIEYEFLISTMHATCPAHLILLNLITPIISSESHKLWSSSSSPSSHHFFPLSSKYSPHHLITPILLTRTSCPCLEGVWGEWRQILTHS